MHSRRQHSVDLRDGARQLLAERENHLRPLLERRGHDPVLLEHFAQRDEVLLREAIVVEDADRFGEAAVVDADRDAAVFAEDPPGRNAVLQQHGNHFIGLPLVEIDIEVGPARRKQREHACRRRDASNSIPLERAFPQQQHRIPHPYYCLVVSALSASVAPRSPRATIVNSASKILALKMSPIMSFDHCRKYSSLPNRSAMMLS